MKRPRKCLIVAITIVFLTAGWFGFSRLTVGSKIKGVFPSATPYANRFNSDDVVYDDLLRIVVPTFFRDDEQMGMELSDAAEPLDLEARFSKLAGIHFTGVKFIRCKIDRLPKEARGLMIFEDCDFSKLPPEQRALLRPYDPENPAYMNTFVYGTV